MNLLYNTVVTISQTVINANYFSENFGIGLNLIAAIMIGTFLTIKKTSEAEQGAEVFLDESLYFAREESRPHLSKFPWTAIRKQKIGGSSKEINVIKQLNELLKETKYPFIVLSGQSGFGKTKMLYEFAKETKKNRTVFASWNLPGISSEQIIAEYKELPNASKYILLDDVFRNPKKAVQFCISLMPVKEKFILAVRDTNELMNILKEFHLKAEIFILDKMENINDLLEISTEPWINSDIKEKLSAIAKGNPEVLSIGHEFIDQQCQDNLRFDANEFLDSVKDKKSLFDSISNYFLENLGRATLAVISRAVIFNGLERNDAFCKANFKSYTKLRNLNYFYVQDDRLFFKPAILGEYITHEYYFFKEKIAPAFSNLLEDAHDEDFGCVLSTIIDFYRQRKLSVYKEAAAFLLSIAKIKGVSDNTILNLLLRNAEELEDSRIVFDAIKDLNSINIETTDYDLINRFAIFCAQNKVFDCAAKWWEKLLDLAKAQKNENLIMVLYNNLGLVYFNLKAYDKAIESYTHAYDKFEATGNNNGIIQSLNSLAQLYQKKQDWQHSVELYKKEIDELKKINDIKRTARIYVTIAQIYKSNDIVDQAFENYVYAAEYYEQSKDVRNLARTYGNMGIISNGLKEWDKAVEYFRKTLECEEKIGNIKGIARTHNNLALVFQDKGDVEKAIKYFELAIEKSKFINDEKNLAQTYSNLALIFQKKRNFKEAREFHHRALAEFEKLENNKAISLTLNKLGQIHQRQHEWEHAIECFQKSIKFRGKTGDLQGVEQIYRNLGIAFQAIKKYDAALTAYQHALDRMERFGDFDGLAQTFSNLGVIYFDVKDYKEALKLLNQSLFYYLKMKSVGDIKKVSTILSSIQKEMDDFEFSRFADAALDDVANNGIKWNSQTILSADETQNILKKMKKRKKKRMAQMETEMH